MFDLQIFDVTKSPELYSLENAYIVASVVVAVLAWIEVQLVRVNAGKVPEGLAYAALSFLPTSWIVVSGLAMYFLDFDNLGMSVPVVYGIHSAIGWVRTMRAVSSSGVDDPADFVVPVPLMNYYQSFHIVFFGFCLFVLSRYFV